MVLLVDDDATFLQRVKQLLQKRTVLMACDGAHALRLLEMDDFSVALVDLDLPDCNGFELIKSFRRMTPNMPVVAISGVFSPSVLESAKLFGAVETLRKPATADWTATIERVCASTCN